jgi:Pro-kumamolisin, activation domain
MTSNVYVDLIGSNVNPQANVRRIADVAGSESIEVSVYLKPHTSPGAAVDTLPFAERRAALRASRTAEHDGDIRLLREFAAAHGLTVSAVEPAQRLVKLSGSATNIEAAFQTKLGVYHDGAEQFRGYSGPIRISQDLEPVVRAVLGLDTRRAAEPHFIRADDVTAHLPNEVGKLYNFPTSGTGAGQCIAIVELGYRCGYLASDITTAFQNMGLPTPTVVSVSVGENNNPDWSVTMIVTDAVAGTGNVVRLAVDFTSFSSSGDTVVVSGVSPEANGVHTITVVDGTHIELRNTVFATPYTSGGTVIDVTNQDEEVALDIQVAGGIAPGARLAVYFAPNTHNGFANAVYTAVHDSANNPSVVSISWGSMEETWSAAERQVMDAALSDAALLGVSVFVASGDDNSTDGATDGQVHVDYPAASPWAIGCGGTQIDATGTTINSEIVWNVVDNNGNASGTGGGISRLYPIPLFQLEARLPGNFDTNVPGRGVPDVAGNASSASGYKIVVNGQTSALGGTSAVAPLWAGLAALINEAASEPIGFFLPTLYKNPSALRVIAQGNNFPPGTSVGYSASTGWSGCTGLGVPIGYKILAPFVAARPFGLFLSAGNPQAYVFCLDADNLISYRINGAGTQWARGYLNSIISGSRLTQAPLAKGAPFSIISADNKIHVLYRDVNGHISDVYFSTTQFGLSYGDLTQISGAPLALGDPSAFVSTAQMEGGGGYMHVVYRDANREIGNIATGDFASRNSFVTNAALAQGDPFSVIFRGSEVHVLYRDVNNHISDICLIGMSGWHYKDLTALTGAPLAQGDPSAVEYGGQLYIFYRDASNHVASISHDPTRHTWTYQDMTAVSRSPLAKGDPFSIVYPNRMPPLMGNSSMHVLYRDVNDQIADIAAWSYQNLTTVVPGAPLAKGDPSALVLAGGDELHVFYPDTNNQVTEVRYSFIARSWFYQDLN